MHERCCPRSKPVCSLAHCLLPCPPPPQVEEPSNPHGLQHAWAYVARVINYMPITRNSAAALQAFLRVAGYCMAKVGSGLRSRAHLPPTCPAHHHV